MNSVPQGMPKTDTPPTYEELKAAAERAGVKNLPDQPLPDEVAEDFEQSWQYKRGGSDVRYESRGTTPPVSRSSGFKQRLDNALKRIGGAVNYLPTTPNYGGGAIPPPSPNFRLKPL